MKLVIDRYYMCYENSFGKASIYLLWSTQFISNSVFCSKSHQTPVDATSCHNLEETFLECYGESLKCFTTYTTPYAMTILYINVLVHVYGILKCMF